LTDAGTRVTKVWFGVGAVGSEWWSYKYPKYNQDFLQSMIFGAQVMGVPYGVFTNENKWVYLMGNITYGPQLPLWFNGRMSISSSLS
jgi:hypothetical protein